MSTRRVIFPPAEYWTQNHQKDTMTTPPADIDLSAFPDVVNAVLDLMPNGAMWRARFAEKPGLHVQPADEHGYITVLHRGDTVMRIHLDTFAPGAILGDAQIVVGGHWQQIGLEWHDATNEIEAE